MKKECICIHCEEKAEIFDLVIEKGIAYFFCSKCTHKNELVKNICRKIHLIVSKNLSKQNSLLEDMVNSCEIIQINGCASLDNFKKHLVRNNSTDFDINIIENILFSCECGMFTKNS